MSTVIRSCPGCKSLILSDTDQCPECGHVFHERKQSVITEIVDVGSMKSASLVDPCPHCGEMVRTGLVRCWNCNGFMREDIAARYRKMTSNPQQIIYSTIPPEQRTDYLPARDNADPGAVPKVYDADDFVLSDDTKMTSSSTDDSGFTLGPSTKSGQPAAAQPTAGQSAAAPTAVPKSPETAKTGDGPDKPQTKTSGGQSASEKTAATAKSDGTEDAGDKDATKAGAAAAGSGQKAPDNDVDLASIAMQEEREVKKRRNEKLAERQRQQMLVPCTCGAWIRVSEDQAGKMVRCRQCKQAVQVPQIRRKVEKKDEKPAAAKLSMNWIEDIRFFRLVPTSLVLKPGSVADKFVDADIAVTDSKLVIVAFTGGDKKKRSLLGKAPKVDRAEQRKAIREQIAATGDFRSLTDVEVHSITSAHVAEIRLVQPILKASESMFAGVPVFGDGRIALFLPIALENNEQAYCSASLTTFRALQQVLKSDFNLELPSAENGVPETEKTENLSCFINQSRVESITNLNYYQQDPGFELELTGYRCKACTAVISEEGRKKNKLGGANGKGIAKAKCPKCSGKIGEDPLYRITKSPAPVATGDSSDA